MPVLYTDRERELADDDDCALRGLRALTGEEAMGHFGNTDADELAEEYRNDAESELREDLRARKREELAEIAYQERLLVAKTQQEAESEPPVRALDERPYDDGLPW